LFYVGLSTNGKETDALVRLVAPKKLPFNLNMRNSQHTKTSMTYLCKTMSNPEILLQSLSLKFNYPVFEEVLTLSNCLKANRNLIKLDLSSNALISLVARYVMDALMNNQSVTDLDISGNMLDNEFAVDLSYLLEEMKFFTELISVKTLLDLRVPGIYFRSCCRKMTL
jgi:Leucine-rich repeat (LRR) protein